jgi:hypothetical protein
VAGVWAAPADVRARDYRQAHEGICQHSDWIKQHPAVILGDCDDNASFRSAHWRELLHLLKPLGLKSAYHHHVGEEFDAETRPTHFHKGSRTSLFHIDCCFLPDAWMPCVRSVQVGTYDDWHAFSDDAGDRGPRSVAEWCEKQGCTLGWRVNYAVLR